MQDSKRKPSLGSRVAHKEETQYSKMVDKASPPTTWPKNCAFAFLFGGGICTLGEGLFTLYHWLGMAETEARVLVSISLMGLAALFTVLKIFDNIAKIAGAGTLVPITGFANGIVSPAMEFRSEGFVLGVGAKLFVIAGPVLVYGITASVLYGVILWTIGLFW